MILINCKKHYESFHFLPFLGWMIGKNFLYQCWKPSLFFNKVFSLDPSSLLFAEETTNESFFPSQYSEEHGNSEKISKYLWHTPWKERSFDFFNCTIFSSSPIWLSLKPIDTSISVQLAREYQPTPSLSFSFLQFFVYVLILLYLSTLALSFPSQPLMNS